MANQKFQIGINRPNRTGARDRSSTRLTKTNAAAIQDPALNGRWFTYVEDAGGPTEVLVEHHTIPFQKTQPTSRYTAGMFRHYPGAFDVDGIQVVFYEVWDYRVTNWLNNWRKAVYNPLTGIYGMAKYYRREFVTEFYPPQSEQPTMRRSYVGCFPIEQQPFELTYAEVEGRLTVSALFAVNGSDTLFYGMQGDSLPSGYDFGN